MLIHTYVFVCHSIDTPMFFCLCVYFSVRQHVVEYPQLIQQSKAHWLSVNGSEHPSNLSLSADLGSLPHNCRFIHTTHGHTLNSFFVGSLRIPLISHPLFFPSCDYRYNEGKPSVKTGPCFSFCCDYQALFALPLKTLLKTSVSTAGYTSCDHLSKSQALTVFQSVRILCRAQTCSKASYRCEPNIALESSRWPAFDSQISSSSSLSLPPHPFL